MEDMEMLCFQIISNAGEARSISLGALEAARNGRFDEAGELLNEAGERLKDAHKVHMDLITLDAEDKLGNVRLIMVHSEDIMMGAEITSTLAREMVELYKR